MFHHSHAAPAHAAQTPETQGRTIRWAWRYDLVVNILSLGRAGVIREMTAGLAHIQAGDSVLDVGCGTGDLTLIAKRLAGVGGACAGSTPRLR